MSFSYKKELLPLRDESYAAFMAKLLPTLDPSVILGVRLPALRAFYRERKGDKEFRLFLQSLPHETLEENLLHAISLEKEEVSTIRDSLRAFLPYVDNWEVADLISPKCFSRHKDATLLTVKECLQSSHTYTLRFGMKILMQNFFDEDFRAEYLEWGLRVPSGEYYLHMMKAWFFAEALVQHFDAALPYLLERRMEKRTHNMTIQKALDSFRIPKERKELLRSLRQK